MNSQLVQLGLAALAFLIALWLVVVIARMLMGGRLRLPGGRTRQARLGIVDAFDLDRQRQLIIVRRDNTEHLIMIGGPNDVVIESEIVRVEARDFRDARREKGIDGFTDVRVPAPFVAPAADGSAPTTAPPTIPRQEEPLLPMPLPETVPPLDMPLTGSGDVLAPAPVVSEPSTTRPTFPLPPRRPAPPMPERRPTPPPAPDRATRTVEPDAPRIDPDVAPPPPPPPLPPVIARTLPPLPIPTADDTTRPASTRPSPFMKPLPPRPPLRPLKRVTPQAEPTVPPPVSVPSDTVPTGWPQAPGPAPTPPAIPPVRPTPPAPKINVEPPQIEAREEDGLASLEEEMAKLLGR